MNIKKGDSVIVKEGVKDPDSDEFEIGGWQGRVIDIDNISEKNNTLITVEWDSITLKQMDSNTDIIAQSERDGFGWDTMTLDNTKLEKSKARDTKKDVIKTQEEFSNKYHWAWLGDEGIRISKILKNVNPGNEMDCLQKWVDYLEDKLTFPFDAIVEESESDWLIKEGQKVSIKSVPHIVDTYGVIATLRIGRKKYEYPLCELDVIDKKSPNAQPIDDYKLWFANR
ncbi:calcium-binding protein [Anaerophaga thermohalophila]|uniref:calcium-binding protein n=1 Tax=Anaerophaga thermohalophila TaxID=177400 RepID=UPI000237D22E|nr:calcium-binding protein [Anaerophaga thermohalophila]